MLMRGGDHGRGMERVMTFGWAEPLAAGLLLAVSLCSAANASDPAHSSRSGASTTVASVAPPGAPPIAPTVQATTGPDQQAGASGSSAPVSESPPLGYHFIYRRAHNRSFVRILVKDDETN
jgi:hypothetical protein